MRHNDPVRVNWRKGYGAIYWLNLSLAANGVDDIHPSLNRSCPDESLLLSF